MIFWAELESSQKPGAALAFFSSSARVRFASTSKVLLDLFELLGDRYESCACVVHMS